MACLQPGQDLTADDLVDRADQAMYAAKQAGRDRIAISEAGP
jgi:GGDEF domain-containing protein